MTTLLHLHLLLISNSFLDSLLLGGLICNFAGLNFTMTYFNTSPLKIVATIQFAPVMGNVEASMKVLEPLLDLAFTADLVVLPELASTGYCFANLAEAQGCAEEVLYSKFVKFLEQKARQHNYLVVAGMNEMEDGLLYNSSVLVGKNGLIGKYRKLHLFDNEVNIFEKGNVGLPVFETEIGKIGLLVCYDWMFSEPWRVLALKGAEVVCHSANLVLPFCQTFLPTYAYINGFSIISSNRVGEERGVNFMGESMVVDNKGSVLVKAGNEVEILWTELDLTASANKSVFKQNDLLKDRRIDVYGNFNL